MNDKINDGGSAFAAAGDGGHQVGMSLRDYFAADVLPACYTTSVAYFELHGYPENWRNGIAQKAYKMADAMLAAREAKS